MKDSWTDAEVKVMAERASVLVEDEIRKGAYGRHYKENAMVRDAVDEALAEIENGIEWVFEEIEEGRWQPSSGPLAPRKVGKL